MTADIRVLPHIIVKGSHLGSNKETVKVSQMNRFRTTLIALITTILVTASLGQDLGEIFAKAQEAIEAESYR